MGFLEGLEGVRLPKRLLELRANAKGRLNPATEDETLNLLLAVARMRAPKRILEIGTAEGLTSVALLLECEQAHITTIENDSDRYLSALKNLEDFGVKNRADVKFGDAADVLPALSEAFDLIFLDGPKAQYIHYLPRLKQLLSARGVLFADDVLLYGWVSGKTEVPYKRRSIVERLREYLSAVSADPDLITSILDIGEGVAISVRK